VAVCFSVGSIVRTDKGLGCLFPAGQRKNRVRIKMMAIANQRRYFLKGIIH